MLKSRNWCLLVLAASLALGSCSEEPGGDGVDIEPGESKCARDEADDPVTAVALSVGETVQGYVCPVEDEDWFTLDIPASDKLFTVGLSLSAPLSAVEPNYTLWSIANGAPDKVAAQPPSTQIGAKLAFTHCVDPGKYFLVVNDSGNDAEDFRHPYSLDVTTAPDPDSQEPNGDAATATTMQLATPVTGYVACRGDEDWFLVNVPDGKLMSIQLTSAVATYEPAMRLYNTAGDLLVDETNPSGSVAETNIQRFEVLPGAGNYHIVVSDDDNEDADPNVPYTLTVELIDDDDPNEPNNHPDEATALSTGAVSCGANFSSSIEVIGTIGSPGDDDWFKIPLSGCDAGLIEAEMELQVGGRGARAQWDLANQIQATLTLVRGHGASPCDDDGQCTALQASCEEPLDCAGLFETCLGDGLCSGATVCLPEGVCGANSTQRRYECPPRLSECQPSDTNPPPANTARVSAPLRGESAVYLRASDFQSDGSAPDVPYTLRVRVRADPDAHETNNIYTNQIQNPLPVRAHQGLAVEVPVHDCVTGDCCDGSTWVTGSIGYEFDLDWYKYQHPCPGMDCTLRMHYQVDGGPVDVVLNIFRGGSLWFSAYDVDEQPMQGGMSGTLGGTTAADTCYYAYQGHNGSPFWYYVMARDLNELYSDDENIRPESKDWDSNQTYSFCVEKLTNDCSTPPCELFPDGCGQPQ